MSSITNSSCSREDSLDWEGELKVPKNLLCPSFSVGGLIVKVCRSLWEFTVCRDSDIRLQDFIVSSISAADPRKSLSGIISPLFLLN